MFIIYKSDKTFSFIYKKNLKYNTVKMTLLYRHLEKVCKLLQKRIKLKKFCMTAKH